MDVGNCNIYCSQSTSCTNLNVYSINGISSLTFDCNNDYDYCQGITVICGHTLNETCIFNDNGECIGYCSNYTNNYTNNYINTTNIISSLYHFNNSIL